MTISNYTEDIKILIDDNIVSNMSVSSSALVKLRPDNFSSYGAHKVTIRSSNSFFWFPLFYEEAIEFTVNPLQSIFLYNELTNFTLVINNGSNLILNLFIVSQKTIKLMRCIQNQTNFVVPTKFESCEKMKLIFNLSNAIYQKTSLLKISVVPNAKDYNVTFSGLYIVPPDILQIRIETSNCSPSQKNITATLIIDGQEESTFSLSKMIYNISHILPLGKHNVTVLISSPINSVVTTENITVATNATLETTKTKCFVKDTVNFTIENTIIPMESFKINITDDRKLYEYPFNNVSYVFWTFSKEGSYNFSWTISCPYFIKSGTFQILVFGKLTSITVKNESITIPDGMRTFNITVESTGSSSGNCTVDYGDGTGSEVSNHKFPTNFILQKNYTKVANYTFHVACTAELNSINATTLTDVTKINLNDFSLDYLTIIPLNSSVDFLLRYNGNQNPPYEYMSAKWDFGDGKINEQKNLSNYNTTHLYETFGNYSGFLTLAILDEKRNIPFDIQVGLFIFSPENTTILAKTAFKGFFELVSPGFPTDPQITYKITFRTKVHVEQDKKTVNLIPQPIHFSYQLNNTGVYTVTYDISGSSFQESFKLDKVVLVVNSIVDLKLGAPEKLATYETLKINVSAGLKTQDLINVTCNFTLSNGQDKTESGDITKTSVIEVAFKNLPIGQIEIHVHCFNALSSERLFENVTITSDCFKNGALFMNMNQNSLDPIQLQNSRENTIRSEIKIMEKCKAFKIYYLWKFRNNIEKGALLTVKKNEKPGLYRIDLTVTLNNTNIRDHVYINLTLPDIEAIIKGGSIIMIPKKQFTVDAASLSYDPYQDQGLNYSWSCRVITDGSKIFDQSFNLNSVDFLRRSQGTGCPSLENAGKLLIYSSDVEEKKSYIFRVKVFKDNRTATTRQAIFITPQKIIPLQIG